MVNYDVVVIGAGPVGGALACGLAAQGAKVALVDKAPLPPMEHPDFDGRAYAIAAGSRRLLEMAGLWERLPYAPCPIRDIRVTDGKPGRPASPLALHFAAREVGDEAFGWIIEARALRMALNRQIEASAGVVLFAPALAAVVRNEDQVSVTLDDGRAFTAGLAVAADGRGSALRAQAGIGVTRIPYKQSAVVCAVAHEKPHEGLALEHFLPGGPFAQLPMTGNEAHPNLSAIVFTDAHEIVARLAALDDAAFQREVVKRLGDYLGRAELVGRRWTYRLSAMLAARYYATRLVLVGDSAHGIHPIAGQGLNLGFQDALALLDVLTGADDFGAPALLAAYQRARRPANLAMLAATDTLDRLFSTDFPPLRLARDVGLAVVDRMPGLKRRFMLTAMGR
jgi:2-octaprenyl-6-methoxyphenol hydroxylase